MADDLAVRFGDVVRRLRLEAQMTQEDLAGEAAITTNYIGMVERGESNVTLTAATKIATALKTKLSVMLQAMDA